VVWPQNHSDGFRQFGFKTGGDGFWRFGLKTYCDGFLWFGLKTSGDSFLQFGLKNGGDSFLQFDLKTGDDGFLQFDLKTGGDDFFRFDLKISGGFLGLGLKNKVVQSFLVWPSKSAALIGDLSLKITMTISWFEPQNQVGFGLSVAPQNRRSEVGAGHASRSSRLLRMEASLARVSQSDLKTGGWCTWHHHRGCVEGKLKTNRLIRRVTPDPAMLPLPFSMY
jgi:hypothetical protein